MTTILDQIIATKVEELAARKAVQTTTELERLVASSELTTPLGFVDALRTRAAARTPGFIAEIKKASPSKGVIREDFDPVAIAEDYAANGAACLSVLTDEQYFQGADAYLRSVRQSVDIPIIRKDFTIDPYQIVEARLMEADCVLLIVSALTPTELKSLYRTAQDIGLDVLIEVHDAAELEIALSLDPTLIGINNRNLKTFSTSLNNTFDLLSEIPVNVTVVTESGIATREDVNAMIAHDVYCFLVGEALMRQHSPGMALSELFDR